MGIVLNAILIVGGVALAYYVWKTNSTKEAVTLKDLSEARLVDEFIQSAETSARFYNRASRPPKETSLWRRTGRYLPLLENCNVVG